jgi:hypothetical protein
MARFNGAGFGVSWLLSLMLVLARKRQVTKCQKIANTGDLYVDELRCAGILRASAANQ